MGTTSTLSDGTPVVRSPKHISTGRMPKAKVSMNPQQEQLMGAWDRLYQVDAWKCTGQIALKPLQGIENKFVKQPCVVVGRSRMMETE